MPKTRLNISLDQDLANFIKIFARENRTTASEVITQFILGLNDPAASHGVSTNDIFYLNAAPRSGIFAPLHQADCGEFNPTDSATFIAYSLQSVPAPCNSRQ